MSGHLTRPSSFDDNGEYYAADLHAFLEGATINKDAIDAQTATSSLATGDDLLIEAGGNLRKVTWLTMLKAIALSDTIRNYKPDTGSANAYSVTLTAVPSAYEAGLLVRFKAANANTGASTLNVNGLGAKSIKKAGNEDLSSSDIRSGAVITCVYDGLFFQAVGGLNIGMTDAAVVTAYNAAVPQVEGTSITEGTSTDIKRYSPGDIVSFIITHSPVRGKVVQVVTDENATYSSHTTQIPPDDTIPQNTEGEQILAASITPSNAASVLLIHVDIPCLWLDWGKHITVALFVDSQADALAASMASGTRYHKGVDGAISFRSVIAAGTTSSRTYKVRIGPESDTLYLNGNNSNRFFGGTSKASLTIMEVLP